MLYVTKQDELRKAAVAAYIEGYWNCRGIDMGDKYPVDYLFGNEDEPEFKVKAAIEIKTRAVNFGGFEDYFVDQAKIEALFDTARKHDCKAYLVVTFFDRIAYIDLQKHGYGYKRSVQRTQAHRNDPNDTDMMSHYHWDQFKTIYNKSLDTLLWPSLTEEK